MLADGFRRRFHSALKVKGWVGWFTKSWRGRAQNKGAARRGFYGKPGIASRRQYQWLECGPTERPVAKRGRLTPKPGNVCRSLG